MVSGQWNWMYNGFYSAMSKRHLSDAAELINICWLLSLPTSCRLLFSFEWGKLCSNNITGLYLPCFNFQWVGAAIVFALPTLLWRGKPIPENPSGKSEDLDDDYYNEISDSYYGTIFKYVGLRQRMSFVPLTLTLTTPNPPTRVFSSQNLPLNFSCSIFDAWGACSSFPEPLEGVFVA